MVTHPLLIAKDLCVFIANSKAIKHIIALYENQNFLVFVMCQGRVTLRTILYYLTIFLS